MGAGKLLKSTLGTQYPYPTWDRSISISSLPVKTLDKKHPPIQIQDDTLTGNMYWNNENTYYVIASTNMQMDGLGKEISEKVHNHYGHKNLSNYVLPSFRPATEGLDGLKQERFKPAVSGKDVSDIKSISFYLPSFMKDVEGQTKWFTNKSVREYISDKNQIYRIKSIYIPGGVRSYFDASKAVNYNQMIIASAIARGLKIERLEHVVINDVPGFYYEAISPHNQTNYIAALFLFPLQSDEMVVITYDAPTKPSQEVASEIRRVIESTQLERYEDILKTEKRLIYQGLL